MRKKRFSARIISLMVALCISLAGCAPLVPEDSEETGLVIYASFYPIYALTDLIAHNAPGVSVYCLIQPQDGCLRSYEISDWDWLSVIYSADVAVLGGRGLESFEGDLYSLGDAGPAVLVAMADLNLYSREGSADAQSDEATHFDGENPHLYMSVSGAVEITREIARAMAELDPEYADAYWANLAGAEEKLSTLMADMLAIAADVAGGKVILMNEALIYLARDLSLEVDIWYDRESGAELYVNELSECLEILAEGEAKVILIEKQAPDSLIWALEDAGYSVARIDILSTLREDLGYEGYFSAQLANAAAIAGAFAKLRNDSED